MLSPEERVTLARGNNLTVWVQGFAPASIPGHRLVTLPTGELGDQAHDNPAPCRCRRCNRELTHPDSRRRGIGPICMAKEIWEAPMEVPDKITALEALYREVRETGESSGNIQEMIEALRSGKTPEPAVMASEDTENPPVKMVYVKCRECEWQGWVPELENEPPTCGCCDSGAVDYPKPPAGDTPSQTPASSEPDPEPEEMDIQNWPRYPQDPDEGEKFVRWVFEDVFPANLPGYEARKPQVDLAVAIARALATGEHLVSEAGTGTGKSLAYLVPAIWFARKAGRPVVVTTGTIALQEQISTKDIPFLQKTLDVPFEAALVKGKGNYLCLSRLEEETKQATLYQDPEMTRVMDWARTTRTGDKSEINPIPPADVWGAVNVDDTCSKRDCPFYSQCHYFRARKQWAEADILVCNHKLYFADLAIKGVSSGGAGVLPQYSAVVFDEAHHIEPVASDSFGLELGQFRIPAVIKDIRKLRHPDTPDLLLRQIEDANRIVFERPLLVDPPIDKVDVRRLPDLVQEQMRTEMAHLGKLLLQLDEALEGLDWGYSDEKSRQKCQKYQERILRLAEALQALERPHDGYVNWISVERAQGKPPKPVYHQSPISVAHDLMMTIWQPAWSTISTSATISTGGDFNYFKRQVGLDLVDRPIRELLVDSPFDYQTQARLYIPRGLPEPRPANEEQYQAAIVAELRDLMQITSGRAFLLFTSYRGLQAAYNELADEFRAAGLTVFKQGDMPRTQLVQSFKDTHQGGGFPVLFATGTFWEGIDIQGEALSCVVIDKIPFARPDDPVTLAKLDAIKSRGGNEFMEYSVPEAAIKLKQGVGRLIRTRSDRGLVVILDPRLRTKPYGRVFLNSMPPMPEISYLDGIAEFIKGE